MVTASYCEYVGASNEEEVQHLRGRRPVPGRYGQEAAGVAAGQQGGGKIVLAVSTEYSYSLVVICGIPKTPATRLQRPI